MARNPNSPLHLGTVHELGQDVEDALEAARAELHEARGAMGAFARVATGIEQSIIRHAEAEAQEARIDLEQLALVKNYLLKASGLARHLGQTAEIIQHQAEGKVEALSVQVQRLLSIQEQAARAQLHQERPQARADGEHPGPGLKAKRLSQPPPEALEAPKAEDASGTPGV